MLRRLEHIYQRVDDEDHATEPDEPNMMPVTTAAAALEPLKRWRLSALVIVTFIVSVVDDCLPEIRYLGGG